MNEWQAKYGPQGLKIIAVSQQTVLGPLGNTVNDLGITYAVAEDSDRDTWEAYGMRFYPSWAFIGADGTLVHRQVGKVSGDQTVQLIEYELGL